MDAIDSIMVRIAEIQATIAGIVKAYAYAPPALNTGALPAFVNTPQAGQHIQIEGEWYNCIRPIKMELFLASWGGSDYQSQSYGFYQPVEIAFLKRPRLQLSTAETDSLGLVSHATLGTDIATSIRKYSDRQEENFYVCEWTLTVEYLIIADELIGG